MKSKITVKKVSRVKVADFRALYIDAGWWEKDYDRNTAFINKAVKGSFCFVGAFDKGRMIGMGRALSDGCSDAYIQDVVVLKKYRGSGIGGKIVAKIIERLSFHGVDWIGLIAEPDSIGFHSRNGFKKMPRHLPMRLKSGRGSV
ncbi:MAG TPA: GNAT family N-acetyltransferase [Victivallales bacterium]|nr:GNAT family N-acetyltransferase [Victivallales bacterium]